MKFTLFLLAASLLLAACKHPLAIRGNGDIVERNGTGRGCTLEQFEAGEATCTENEVLDAYVVRYLGMPHPGWYFERWEGPCDTSDWPFCQLSIPAEVVAQVDLDHPDIEIPPSVAVFSPLVALQDFEISDPELANCLARKQTTYLHEVTSLRCEDKGIEDISDLARFTGLRSLFLTENRITDLKPLANLPRLEDLRLSDNQISDIGPLKKVKTLRTLGLARNNIERVKALQGLRSLSRLDLNSNQLVDITPLAKLRSMQLLGLYGNQILDLSPLASLVNLSYLDIGLNPLSQLEPLNGLTRLTFLSLLGSDSVSCDDAEAISQTLPDARVLPPAPCEPTRFESIVDTFDGIYFRVRPIEGREDAYSVHWSVARSTVEAGAEDFSVELYVGGPGQWQQQVSTSRLTDEGIPINLGGISGDFCLRMIATVESGDVILGSGMSGSEAPCL